MARATRSSAQQEKDKPLEPAPAPRKAASKKRKRTSLSDGTDQPAAKQQRTDDDIKEEVGSQEPDDAPTSTASSSALDLPSSGDVPIHSEYAEKILDILEVVDTQGLLDRVFPLPTEQEDGFSAGPSSSSRTYSFRSLLKEPEQYPLRVLRSAVQHLFPISSHPRSRPSTTAAEQLRFCNLALSLLDQASFHSAPVPLDVESLIATLTSDAAKEAPTSGDQVNRKRKYALVQKLSSGDWWTSTNSASPSASSDDHKAVTDLSTAHADLAAIFPTPSSANMKHGKTLAAYAKKKVVAPEILEALQPRQLYSGKFLDYGPYASFAPTFDQGGMEVGRVALGEVIFQQERKRRLMAIQEKVRARQIAARTAQTQEADAEDVQIIDVPSTSSMESDKMAESLEGVLSPEEVARIKAVLGDLDLEASVDELITRNSRALQRLQKLQEERLGSGSDVVQPSSEEWEIAQSILESLAVLAALRPRSSGTDSDHPPLVPTASALHKLQRTLPIGDTGGWYGTLPPGRPNALRDDTTVRMKAGTSVVVNTPAAPVPVAPVAIPAPPKMTTPTTSQQAIASSTATTYAFPSYPQHTQQYRGAYGTYNQQQSAQYYTYPPQAQQASQAVTHYPNAQYNVNATGQQQYYPSGWYNYQPPVQQANVATATGGSGRATPQPIPTSAAGTYTFYNGAPQQRAVANTVLSAATSKPYQQGPWPNGTATTTVSPHIPQTLLPHLRGTQVAGTPATPGGTYYQNVQQTTSSR